MNPRPVQLALRDGVLHIQWSDGARRRHEAAELRRECPCAGCRGHQSFGEPTPPPPEVAPGLRIVSMTPAGNYGYKIQFSDGHDTGIYTLEYLRELGQEDDPL